MDAVAVSKGSASIDKSRIMTSGLKNCSVCSSVFELRFAYQQQRSSDGNAFVARRVMNPICYSSQETCSVCSSKFELQFAYQQAQVGGEIAYYCSTACRHQNTVPATNSAPKRKLKKIAVLNQKGGTGKTTTSVNLAAGLAEAGYRTLLLDLDAQGNVAVSLGLNASKTIYHVLVDGEPPASCVVNVSENLDALVSNTSLAQAEVRLVNTPRNRFKVLASRMSSITEYDFIIMDCGPSLSVLNQNALTFADHIIIPVSCDYLSLVGVKQILRTLKKVNELLLHPVSILGVVPTFFDVRTRISLEAVSTLKSYFKERVLPPIRINTKLREAPGHKKTIYEYAPDSRGAQDYARLTEKVVEMCDAAEQQTMNDPPPAVEQTESLGSAPQTRI